MVVQQWQVEDFVKRGYLEDKMNIDMSTPTTAPAGRGLVTWARLWKAYKQLYFNRKRDKERKQDLLQFSRQDRLPRNDPVLF